MLGRQVCFERTKRNKKKIMTETLTNEVQRLVIAGNLVFVAPDVISDKL